MTATSKTKFLIFGSVAVILFLAILVPGKSALAANCGGVTTCDCGDTVTSDYTMPADLSCNGNVALYVGASGITIDCADHSITDTSSPFTGTGITTNVASGNCVESASRDTCPSVQIKNCKFYNFKTAIYRPKREWKIYNNTFFSTETAVYLDSVAPGFNDMEISDNTIYNTNYGIGGYHDPATINPSDTMGGSLDIHDNDILELSNTIVNGQSNSGITLIGPKGGGNSHACSTLTAAVSCVYFNRITSYSTYSPTAPVPYGIKLYYPLYSTQMAHNFIEVKNDTDGATPPVPIDFFLMQDSSSSIQIAENDFSGQKVDVFGPVSAGVLWNSPYPNMFLSEQGSYIDIPSGVTPKPCLTAADIDDQVTNKFGYVYISGFGCLDFSATTTKEYIFPSNVIENKKAFWMTAALFMNVLDCNGYKFRGPGLDNDLIGIDVKSPGKKNTIVGCDIAQFKEGIKIDNTSKTLLRHNTVGYKRSAGDTDQIRDYYIQLVSSPFNSADYIQEMYNYTWTPLQTNPAVMNQALNLINVNSFTGQKKYAVYYYEKNGLLLDGLAGAGKLDLNGDGQYEDIGHLTVANSKDITVKNMIVDSGDPLNFVNIDSSTGSLNSYIYSNASTNNIAGYILKNSQYTKLYKNTAASNKADSYGALIYQIKNSVIGDASIPANGNTFNNNGNIGVFYEGSYMSPNPNPANPEANIFGYNEMKDNGHTGLSVTNSYANKFVFNSIVSNGDSDTTSYSPGLYLNQAMNNVFRNNSVNYNSGDNLYIDSTIMDNGENCNGNPLQTEQNSFLNNNFDNSVKGSGIVLDTDTCSDIWPNYNPTIPGKVIKNYFGFFYLDSSNRNGYSTDPGNLAEISGPDGYKITDYDPSSGTIPVEGANSMSNNFLDGITLTWHSPEKDKKIEQNDFYGNTAMNDNKRYGFYFYGKGYGSAIFGNDAVGNVSIKANELGGVYLYNIQTTRVFGNTITDNNLPANTGFGIRAEANQSSLNYSELGHNLSYDPDGAGPLPALSYKNIINTGTGTKHSVGIDLYNDTYTVVNTNEISTFSKFGIKGYISRSEKIKNNSISAGDIASVGLAIMESSFWTVNNNTIYNIDNTNKFGRYLYVGPAREFSSTDRNNFYPYPTQAIRDYYNHTIDQTNFAGPSDALKKKIIYYYNNSSGVTFTASDNTYHLQIVNSSNFDLTSLPDLDGADPVEIDFYPTTANVGKLYGDFILQNCRGECLILYNISFWPARTITVPIKNFNISSATRSGLKGFYVSNAQFDNLTMSAVNSGFINENGGMYLYNSNNNQVTNSKFTYVVSDALAGKKWELYLAGFSQGNTVEQNIFGNGGANSGSGAYEVRAGLTNKEYKDATLAEMASDGICAIVNGDTKCDPNCTFGQLDLDTDCDSYTSATCTNTAAVDCCLDKFDSTLDLDCPAGVDPDGLGAAISTAIDDGLCSVTTFRGDCDPNCTVVADSICDTKYDACNSSLRDCCNPDPNDDTCDYDCPAGFDPDCVAQNAWCEPDGTNNNTFNLKSASPNLNVPNYFIPPPINKTGGGGRPNDSYFCYVPRMRFEPTFPVVQGDSAGYRKLAISAAGPESTRGRYKYRFTSTLRFADIMGLGLRANIVTSRNVSDFVGQADFYSLPSDPMTASFGILPTIDNSAAYRLGTSIGYIQTPPLLLESYPVPASDLWATASNYNKLQKVVWDWSNNPARNWPNTTGLETYYARILATNEYHLGQTNPAPQDSEDADVIFSYDYKPPCGGVAASCPSSGTPKIASPNVGAKVSGGFPVTWAPLNNPTDESSWTAGKAHYEIWYAATAADANARSDTNSNPNDGPFLWDDIGWDSLSGLSPYYENKTAPDCSGAKTKCDSLLANIGQGATKIMTALAAISVNLCAVDDYGNETCGNAPAVMPWVQTKYGDILAGGNLSAQNPPPSANATFMLLSGGVITNWDSARGAGAKLENYQPVKIFPTYNNDFTTSAGSLWFLQGYGTVTFPEVLNRLRSRYGDKRLVDLGATMCVDGASSLPIAPNPLGGKIYYYDGDCLVDEVLSFENGTGNLDGSGLIIINGNLTINQNLTYSTSYVPQKLKHIASATWLVLGGIEIDQNVTQVDSNLIALGTAANRDTKCNEAGDPLSCGTINTGGGALALTMRGVLVARQFVFGRTLASYDTPAESVIYDGRLLANPPLGLEQTIQSLPMWKP